VVRAATTTTSTCWPASLSIDNGDELARDGRAGPRNEALSTRSTRSDDVYEWSGKDRGVHEPGLPLPGRRAAVRLAHRCGGPLRPRRPRRRARGGPGLGPRATDVLAPDRTPSRSNARWSGSRSASRRSSGPRNCSRF
jgi:hypothetical protein